MSPVRLRAEKIDCEDDKRHADRDQQSIARDGARQETPDYGADHRRWRHPRKEAPVHPPGPNVGERCGKSRDGRDTDVRARACRRARGNEDEHREADVSEYQTDETAHECGGEAPDPDEDEEKSVHALEYPLCPIGCAASTNRFAKSCRSRSGS